ncbi:Dextranase precursor [Thalassoglobus neptunius]|uniref:Dextranase n=1 Tax=Thalassoglobus neptunius TaxID=1938619 RepID=A0A5C5WNH2_9PLAN|nr:hypothetical protein [Thalassoglobus neptunius]TWT51639.1 Dextranase precursor [Thalassoglobus neptunius]
MRIRRFIVLLFLVLLVHGTTAVAQPEIHYSGQVGWNEDSATMTFCTSGSMPVSKEGFFWDVPSTVKRIVIDENVRFTGGFRVLYREPTNPLHIVGRHQKTSVIFGTNEEAWTARQKIAENEKWKYSAISVIEDAVVHVSGLTVRDPRGYLISGYANKAVIHVDSCTLIDTRSGNNNNSDGFAGAAGSSIRNTLISTADDGIKIYNDITLENVVIEHHRNGAPLQFGWGGESRIVNATISNLTIRGIDPEHRYNMAPFTWERGEKSTRNVTINGLDVSTGGQLYDEESGEWVPLGLLELKPANCEFNLKATAVQRHGLPLGMNRTTGTIQLDELPDRESSSLKD